MYFCSGQPMHFCFGVDTLAVIEAVLKRAKVSLEIGAWRDPTLVEFDKNATAREARKRAIFPLL